MKRGEENTGRFHRVTLQKSTQTTNGMGGVSLTWSDVRDIFVRFVPKTGVEETRAGRTVNPHTYSGWTRYAPDIWEGNRIRWGDYYYQIEAILDPTGERLEVEMILVKAPSEGEAV